jgi:hypothetical protein
MRYVSRGSEKAPKSLTAISKGKTELERAREHYAALGDKESLLLRRILRTT